MSSLAAEVAGSAEIAAPAAYPNGVKLAFVKFQQIRFYHGHPFRLYHGERLEDMVESIRKNGILTPLIIRRIDDQEYKYEMLAGHNRMNAGMIAGLDGAWCLIKDVLSDQEAFMYVVETNLLQRSFSELLPSEKAAVLALRYSEMFSQGKRNDIIAELGMMEHSETGKTCGTEFHRLNSRESIGQDYSLTGRQIANYLRINELIEPLKLRLDNGEFIIKVGVAFSFISEDGQTIIDSVLAEHGFRINENIAGLLRRRDAESAFNETECLEIIEKKIFNKPVLSVKVSQKVYSKYFKPNTPSREIEQVIDDALNLYFSMRGQETA